MAHKQNRYTQILERVFFDRFEPGKIRILFEREDLNKAAAALGLESVKNLGDIVYTFNFRMEVPESLAQYAHQRAQGKNWLIRHVGRGSYEFSIGLREAIPNPNLAIVKVPDATPGMIIQHAFTDEQATLAKVRYNRLVDIFTGVTCYSLQSHLRTTVSGIGQIETDEVYVGVNKAGVQYVFPIEAKGEGEKIGAVQVEQDLAMAAEKFPDLICTGIVAQSMEQNTICLMSFSRDENGEIRIYAEKHYCLVPPDKITKSELARLRDSFLAS